MILMREKLERTFREAGIVYKSRQALIMRILLFLSEQPNHRFEDRPSGRVSTLVAHQLGLDSPPSQHRIWAAFTDMQKMGLIDLDRGVRRTYAIWLPEEDFDPSLIDWMKTQTGWTPTAREPEREPEREAPLTLPEIPAISYGELAEKIDSAALLEAGIAYLLRRLPEVGFLEVLSFAERFLSQAAAAIQRSRQRMEQVVELEAEIERAQSELGTIKKKLGERDAQYQKDEDLIRRQARTIREFQATIEQLRDSVEKFSRRSREETREEEVEEIDRLMRRPPSRREKP